MAESIESASAMIEAIRARIEAESKPEQRKWKRLIGRIHDGKCTPFIGAGACYGSLPLGGTIAKKWAKEYDYPFDDPQNLIRVAQLAAVEEGDTPFVKEKLLEEFFEGAEPPDFSDPSEPHGLLAELPLPVYITTNYDDFMMQALRTNGKDPVREVCRWNSATRRIPSVFSTRRDYQPSAAEPMVFHLHGHNEIPESLVLTEDDYLDFLVNWSADDHDLVPPQIKQVFAGTSLLFVGYAIADWNFRVLHRSLVGYLEKSARYGHVSVQLVPLPKEAHPDTKRMARRYLDKYFDADRIQVIWETCTEFALELRVRMEASNE